MGEALELAEAPLEPEPIPVHVPKPPPRRPVPVEPRVGGVGPTTIAMLFRTKPYRLSASHCRFVGTNCGFRFATRKKMMISAVVSQTSAVILVNQ